MADKHFSAHGEGDASWKHQAEQTRASVLGVAVALTFGFAAVEFIGGALANSLALIGDAGHMVTDSASLLFALAANRLAKKGADSHHSFGHGRIEVLAAFVNGLMMLAVVLWLFWEAFERIANPVPVAGLSVMGIASVGLVINILVAWRLGKDQENLNTRAALVHVLGDLLGSVAAIVAGVVIWMGGPTVVDPILSMVVGVLLLKATYGVLKESSRILMDGVPEDLNYFEVGRALEKVPGVTRIHDLHIWTIAPGHSALQCHALIESPDCWPKILDALRGELAERFSIYHVTVQPEWPFEGDGEECDVCKLGLCDVDFSNPELNDKVELDMACLSGVVPSTPTHKH